MNVPAPNTLGARLREARALRGLTQAQLASLAGTSQAVIQKIENGRSLRPRILEAVAAALDVPPEWLAFGVVGSPASVATACNIREQLRNERTDAA